MHPFDEKYGVETSGMLLWDELETGHPHDIYTVNYYGVAPSLFQQAMERWQKVALGPVSEYTFIDLGAGKGRPVLMAAQMQFVECIGVELNPGLSDLSRKNMLRWQEIGQAVAPMRAVNGDATEIQFPATRCVVYLFNPFAAQVLKKVIQNISKAFANRPGELDIVYINSEFSSVIAKHPGFKQLWEERLVMSPEDAAADRAHQLEGAGELYSAFAGTEVCSAWRWVG